MKKHSFVLFAENNNKELSKRAKMNSSSCYVKKNKIFSSKANFQDYDITKSSNFLIDAGNIGFCNITGSKTIT